MILTACKSGTLATPSITPLLPATCWIGTTSLEAESLSQHKNEKSVFFLPGLGKYYGLNCLTFFFFFVIKAYLDPADANSFLI